MSAMSTALLVTTVAATAVGTAALCVVLGLRRQLSELRTELVARASADARALVPAARSADTEEIRTAVAAALAEERERELAEARAFWAAQEARDIADAPSLLGLTADDLYLPRPTDFVGRVDSPEPHPATAPEGPEGAEGLVDGPGADPAEGTPETTTLIGPGRPVDGQEARPGHPGDSPELAAARRRHPSHPDFVPAQATQPPSFTPIGDHERTVLCLEELAATRAALADVRPGPLGTLDVYVFEDGTTLCMSPGHRETAERLAAALHAGDAPVLLGGSGISGAYALTFSCGEETVYVLADRVIASL
ncbi:hypothetical protein [Streptomyces sp. NPDC049906]|uniref:hypothetical protein n=1 Tax=Streptomyces sp. NPDC049906 TaxID=3155656 RepID=UPI003430C753